MPMQSPLGDPFVQRWRYEQERMTGRPSAGPGSGPQMLGGMEEPNDDDAGDSY